MDTQKEREAFEAVTNIYHCTYNADLNYYFSGSKFVSDKAEIEVNAGWQAWQAAKADVPEGYVLVEKSKINTVVDALILACDLRETDSNYEDALNHFHEVAQSLGKAQEQGNG